MLLRMPDGLAADWSDRVTWETKYRHSPIPRSLRRRCIDRIGHAVAHPVALSD